MIQFNETAKKTKNKNCSTSCSERNCEKLKYCAIALLNDTFFILEYLPESKLKKKTIH